MIMERRGLGKTNWKSPCIPQIVKAASVRMNRQVREKLQLIVLRQNKRNIRAKQKTDSDFYANVAKNSEVDGQQQNFVVTFPICQVYFKQLIDINWFCFNSLRKVLFCNLCFQRRKQIQRNWLTSPESLGLIGCWNLAWGTTPSSIRVPVPNCYIILPLPKMK